MPKYTSMWKCDIHISHVGGADDSARRPWYPVMVAAPHLFSPAPFVHKQKNCDFLQGHHLMKTKQSGRISFHFLFICCHFPNTLDFPSPWFDCRVENKPTLICIFVWKTSYFIIFTFEQISICTIYPFPAHDPLAGLAVGWLLGGSANTD